MITVKHLIVGAGPTGLGAALRLQELCNDEWLVCDRHDCAGGLATSIVDDLGFTWDLGGHVQFSHYAGFDRYMDLALGEDGWLHHQRESWVWVSDRFVPYPFQNNLHRLPPDLRWKCVEGLLKASAGAKGVAADGAPEHLEDWIIKTFGRGLAEVFLFPYNFKVWAYPLSMLGCRWIGERVSVPPIERVIRQVCLEQDDVSWGPNKIFRFPRNGGTGAVWRALAATLPPERMLLGNGVAEINAGTRMAKMDDGCIVKYENILSTMPLDVLVRKAGPRELEAPARSLLHSSTHVIGVGLSGQPPEHLRTKCWMYFPEGNCPFYRVTVFSNYSPNNVPEPDRQWSLMAEVSESPYKEVDPSRVVGDVIQGMINTRMIADAGQVEGTWYRRLDYGYPTPSKHRDEALAVLLPRLEEFGIYSRGRFGAWKYEVSNQDHSFAQGRELVNRLEGIIDDEEGPEPTLNRPDWVNNRHNP